ncbi:MAG: hypothetical protein DMG37_08500 [Acidobacteria bacterium]|nr:MAG: hypothetical protein DMG37_08500 [Acidobacteriota bacterium]
MFPPSWFYFVSSFLNTDPLCITNFTCSNSPMDFSGSPETAMTFAFQSLHLSHAQGEEFGGSGTCQLPTQTRRKDGHSL